MAVAFTSVSSFLVPIVAMLLGADYPIAAIMMLIASFVTVVAVIVEGLVFRKWKDFMPNLELPEDLAETIANMAHIYNDPRCEEQEQNPDGEHIPNCTCRQYFVPDMARRIRNSVDNERILKSIRER